MRKGASKDVQKQFEFPTLWHKCTDDYCLENSQNETTEDGFRQIPM